MAKLTMTNRRKLVESLNDQPELRDAVYSFLSFIEREKTLMPLRTLADADHERMPVTPKQFLEDDYYLGTTAKKLSDTWKDVFYRLFGQDSIYNTLIVTGGIGIGKTTFGSICQVRKLYELSCLRNPASFYGLLPGSKIVFGMFNVTLDKADDCYELIRMHVENSPYFKEHCMPRQRPRDPLFFPTKNIEISVGSLASHALGDDILSFMLDEANFHKKSASQDRGDVQTRAHEMFNAARTRLISRFLSYGGRVPGLITILSSKKFQTDFLDQLIEKVESDPELQKTTMVADFALWQTKDPKLFCGKFFEVLIGTEAYDSRVLEQDEVVPEGCDSIMVPVEYYNEFLLDCDLALRDIAGVSTAGSQRYFPVLDRITQCIDPGRFHPFTRAELSLDLATADPISSFLDVRTICGIKRSRWAPLVNPTIPRYIHIDIAYSQECLALTMGHPCTLGDGRLGVYIDLMLRIRPPVVGQIPIPAVVDFVRYLRNMGFPIAKVSFDQFQSRMPIQLLLQERFVSEVLSVDAMHYGQLKTAFNELRIDVYEYQPLMEEIRSLLKDPKGGRPHHPQGGLDDVSDSLAAVVSSCLHIDNKRKITYSEKDIVKTKPVLTRPVTRFNATRGQMEMRG